MFGGSHDSRLLLLADQGPKEEISESNINDTVFEYVHANCSHWHTQLPVSILTSPKRFLLYFFSTDIGFLLQFI
jgi:hypothetical protein